MPNKRGDGKGDIPKYGYFYLKKIKNIAPNGSRIGDVANFEKQMFNLKTNLI